MPLISIRIPREMLEALKEIADQYGIDVSKVIRCMLEFGLYVSRRIDVISPEIRIRLLGELLREARRREEEAYRAYKSALRSNEYLTRDHDFEEFDDGTIHRKKRHERLREIAERSVEDKEALEGLLNTRYYWANRIKKLARELNEQLKQLGAAKELHELLGDRDGQAS